MAATDLQNSLQALTAVLKNIQGQPPAAPAAPSPAAHVNILDAFKSINTFDIGSRSG